MPDRNDERTYEIIGPVADPPDAPADAPRSDHDKASVLPINPTETTTDANHTGVVPAGHVSVDNFFSLDATEGGSLPKQSVKPDDPILIALKSPLNDSNSGNLKLQNTQPSPNADKQTLVQEEIIVDKMRSSRKNEKKKEKVEKPNEMSQTVKMLWILFAVFSAVLTIVCLFLIIAYIMALAGHPGIKLPGQ